ncbi:MAG: carbohydrate kinase [Fretibacterium sp.]|nr:carbohydrate kinase [Fretibacterium sp.]
MSQATRSESCSTHAHAHTHKKKLVLCSGEILYDFLSTTPGVGLGKSESFEKRPGGSPFNIAVGLARLGQRTAFLTKLGDDAFGLELRDLIEREGIDLRYIVKGKGQNTTLAMAAIDADGKPEFRFYRDNAADVSLTRSEVPEIHPSDLAIYHFGSVALGEPPASETYIQIFHEMKRAGVLTALDPNIRPLYLRDKPHFRPRLLEWISQVDVLKLSDDDLAWTSERSGVEEGLAALPLNPDGLVIVTEGARGARALWQGRTVRVPGFAVKVAETTGCGDSFLAGTLFCLAPLASLSCLDEAKLVETLRFSCACSALVASRRGAANAMPSLEETEAFLRAQ